MTLPENAEERIKILEAMGDRSLLRAGRERIESVLVHIEEFGDQSDRIFIQRNLLVARSYFDELGRREHGSK